MAETLEREIITALEVVENFVAETTGERPTRREIANALRRYFVLNEIKAHVVMAREDGSSGLG